MDIKALDGITKKAAFQWTWGKGVMLAGVVTMAVTRLTEIILPFTFANSYNRKLKNSLNVALGGFEPSFDVAMGQSSALGFELSFKKKLLILFITKMGDCNSVLQLLNCN